MSAEGSQSCTPTEDTGLVSAAAAAAIAAAAVLNDAADATKQKGPSPRLQHLSDACLRLHCASSSAYPSWDLAVATAVSTELAWGIPESAMKAHLLWSARVLCCMHTIRTLPPSRADLQQLVVAQHVRTPRATHSQLIWSLCQSHQLRRAQNADQSLCVALLLLGRHNKSSTSQMDPAVGAPVQQVYVMLACPVLSFRLVPGSS